MASQAGIQQLLGAEKKAAEKVSESRKRKAKRLRQAKDEATAEIEVFRANYDKNYKEHESKILGSRSDLEVQIQKFTKEKLEEMNHHLSVKREQAIKDIITIVFEIKPGLHDNYKSLAIVAAKG